MGKRRRLMPKRSSVISSSVNKKPILKSKSTRRIINEFHLLNKRLSMAESVEEKNAIQMEMDRLGGLEFYQHCSLLGQSKDRGGDTSSILIKYLREIMKLDLVNDDKDDRNEWQKVKLLDVGALRPNYDNCSKWIDPIAIDLNATCPQIRKQDFMEMPVPDDPPFDVISLSLVINFVPTPVGRGEMLKRCRKFLKANGILYVVLPRACTSNSRYCTAEHFIFAMSCLGFSIRFFQETNKLVCFIFELLPGDVAIDEEFDLLSRKQKFRDSGHCNNFHILISTPSELA